MDEADLSALMDEKDEALRLKYKQPLQPEALATGFCLFCGEELNDNRRWCDKECVQLWERDKRRRI